MPQLSCYLCGDFLDVERCETSTKLDTTEMRHERCFDAVPPHLRVPRIQNFLRECVEPSFFAFDDDLEHRKIELWKAAFSRILGPQPTGDSWMGAFPRRLCLASLPRELRDAIARLCYGDSSVHALMLEYSIAQAKVLARTELPPPVREVKLRFDHGVTLFVHRQQIGGRSYIVDIESMESYLPMPSHQDPDTFSSEDDQAHPFQQSDYQDLGTISDGYDQAQHFQQSDHQDSGSFPDEHEQAHPPKQSGWQARTFPFAEDWTHLMFVFDVFGCRDILPFPAMTPTRRVGIWHQYIRNDSAELTCTYGGWTLRAVGQEQPLWDHAYETVPPDGTHFVYLERNAPGFDLPARLIPRTVGHDVTAITAVIYGATIVDIHFHSRHSGIDGTNAFYRSLDRFDHQVTIRYFELWPGEYLQGMMLVRNTELDEESTLSYMFATSTLRAIDLCARQYRAIGFPPGVRLCDMDIGMALDTRVRVVWLNKRTNHLTGAQVRVEADEPAEPNAVNQNIMRLFERSLQSPYEIPPPCLRVHVNDALFRDQMILHGAVDVWERADPRGSIACLGMRAASVIVGSWRDMDAERTGSNMHVWGPRDIISRQNLIGSCLENVQVEGRCSVRLLRRNQPPPEGKHFLLSAGCLIVWWSGVRGNFVDVR